jgi:hypothetical protein
MQLFALLQTKNNNDNFVCCVVRLTHFAFSSDVAYHNALRSTLDFYVLAFSRIKARQSLLVIVAASSCFDITSAKMQSNNRLITL